MKDYREEMEQNLRYQLSRISQEIYQNEHAFDGITLDEEHPEKWLRSNIDDLQGLKANLQEVKDHERVLVLPNFTVQYSLNLWVDKAIELQIAGDNDDLESCD